MKHLASIFQLLLMHCVGWVTASMKRIDILSINDFQKSEYEYPRTKYFGVTVQRNLFTYTNSKLFYQIESAEQVQISSGVRGSLKPVCSGVGVFTCVEDLNERKQDLQNSLGFRVEIFMDCVTDSCHYKMGLAVGEHLQIRDGVRHNIYTKNEKSLLVVANYEFKTTTPPVEKIRFFANAEMSAYSDVIQISANYKTQGFPSGSTHDFKFEAVTKQMLSSVVHKHSPNFCDETRCSYRLLVQCPHTERIELAVYQEPAIEHIIDSQYYVTSC